MVPWSCSARLMRRRCGSSLSISRSTIRTCSSAARTASLSASTCFSFSSRIGFSVSKSLRRFLIASSSNRKPFHLLLQQFPFAIELLIEGLFELLRERQAVFSELVVFFEELGIVKAFQSRQRDLLA